MFAPRKNRNLRKKIDVDDEESAETPDVYTTTTIVNTTGTMQKSRLLWLQETLDFELIGYGVLPNSYGRGDCTQAKEG